MGLVAKGTPATGNRIATKSFINSNYYVNQSASPYNTYASLRCPPYQTIEAGFTNSGTIYFLNNVDGSNFTGFSTRENACSHSTGGSVTVHWSGAFGNGTVLYLDADGIDMFDGNGYFSLGGYSFQTDVATVFDYAICQAVNSAIIWFNNIQDGDPPYPYGYIDAATACSQGGNSGQNTVVYYTGTLGNGTVLYNYSDLTENFSYAGAIFWYWINGYRFTYTFNSIADYGSC
jgi:hypothetical protein